VTSFEEPGHPAKPSDSDPLTPYEALTHPVDACIRLATGKVEEGVLFLSSRSASHAGPETLDEFLNHQRSFLPVRSKKTGRSHLVNRESIQRVEVDGSAPILFRIEEKVATNVELVRLELTDGSVLEGTLCFAPHPDQARLSDYFNNEAAFVPVEIGTGVTYVNKRYIALIPL
jgi:hypothetical protein